MEHLNEKIASINARFPLFRVRAVDFRSRKFPDFSRRPDLRVAIIPDQYENVVYKINGNTRACRIENFVPEMLFHLERLDSFEKMKEGAKRAHDLVNRMGLAVTYSDIEDDIAGKDFRQIEREFVEKFYVRGDILQVFRVRNGDGYGFVTLLDETAFIQKPSPPEAMRELAQAMIVNSFSRGNKTCIICHCETRVHHVAFKCMMHTFCCGCVEKIIKPECPICRAPAGQPDM